MLGVNEHMDLKLFGRENYFRRIPTYVIMIPDRYGQTDGQTDRQTTYCRITPLCAIIAR